MSLRDQNSFQGVAQRTVNDCLAACLATVLELPYEEIPSSLLYDPDFPARQNRAFRDFLAERGLVVWQFGLHGQDMPLAMFGSAKPDYHLHPWGLWLAVVKSPRTGLGHVVVMRAAGVLWDPHPGRDEGHLGFMQAMILMLKGPEVNS